MAILPMIMGNGGSEYTETSLWTNPSPSSSFANQTVTLSDSMDDYKYIGIKYAYSTTVQTGSGVGKLIYLVEDFKKGANPYSGSEVFANICAGQSASTIYTRRVFYRSGGVLFGDATNTSGTASNTYCIPLEILGINELDTEGTISPLLWSNSSPTSNFAEQTIQLDLSEYDGILVEFKGYASQNFPTATGWKCSSYAGKSATQTQPMMYGGSSGNTYFWGRRTMQATDTGVTFGTGLYVTQSGGGVNNNAYCIPMYIYGIKGSVV